MFRLTTLLLVFVGCVEDPSLGRSPAEPADEDPALAAAPLSAPCFREPTIGRDSLGVLLSDAPPPPGMEGANDLVLLSFRQHADGTPYAFVAHSADGHDVLEEAAERLVRSLEWQPFRAECEQFLTRHPQGYKIYYRPDRGAPPEPSHAVRRVEPRSQPPSPPLTRAERRRLQEAVTASDVLAVLGKPDTRDTERFDRWVVEACFGCLEQAMIGELEDGSMYEWWTWDRRGAPMVFLPATGGDERRVLAHAYAPDYSVIY